MDYMDFVQKHRETGADITVSALPMDNQRASDFGLMKARAREQSRAVRRRLQWIGLLSWPGGSSAPAAPLRLRVSRLPGCVT